MQTEIQDALVSINHLAEQWGISRRTITRMLAKGELPSLRIGRRRLIRLADLRRYLNGCEVETPGARATNIARRFAAQ